MLFLIFYSCHILTSFISAYFLTIMSRSRPQFHDNHNMVNDLPYQLFNDCIFLLFVFTFLDINYYDLLSLYNVRIFNRIFSNLHLQSHPEFFFELLH